MKAVMAMTCVYFGTFVWVLIHNLPYSLCFLPLQYTHKTHVVLPINSAAFDLMGTSALSIKSSDIVLTCDKVLS